MIDAVSELGILMLLLLTGMETDVSVVRKSRGIALRVPLTGIAVPFVCGFVLGEALPETMLPHPEQRLITSLFLGTALSISSVKIVAMVVREMDFMRRTVGQLIVTAEIIDDTTCWIIMAVTFGLALHGGIDWGGIGTNEEAILCDAVRLGDRFGVPLRTGVRAHADPEEAILQQPSIGEHNLIVMGVSPRPGTTLFFLGTRQQRC